MKCMRCGEEAYRGTTTEAIDFGVAVLVIRNIPCYKCDECDEIFYTGDVVEKLETITASFKTFVTNFTKEAGQGVTVIDYSNAA